MIVLGTNKATSALTTIDPKNLLLHALILGQSGSGKSFFLARLAEEILQRTKARVVTIDPNGDFETFFAPRETKFWDDSKYSDTLVDLDSKEKALGIASFDSKHQFVEGWQSIIFQQIVAGRIGRMPLSDKAYGAPLKLHWKRLPWEIQDFLLGVDPVNQAKAYQGIATCHHYILNNSSVYPSGASLRDLEDIALDFESRRVVPSLRMYSDAMTLSSEDWNQVRMHFRMVRKQFREILYLNRIKNETGTLASF